MQIITVIKHKDPFRLPKFGSLKGAFWINRVDILAYNDVGGNPPFLLGRTLFVSRYNVFVDDLK